ncbi:MAG: hypothetical protein HQK61_00025 [Desulfamplus sp.]|nr:hypothetical protein [Desulfamplus sp.]
MDTLQGTIFFTMKIYSAFNNWGWTYNGHERLTRYLLYFICAVNLAVPAHADNSTISATSAENIASETYPEAETCPEAEFFKKVESLKIGWQGYILGKELNSSQKETARRNRITASTSKDAPKDSTTRKDATVTPSVTGTYKFRDRELNIVADSKTDRVLIIFQTLERAYQQDVRDMIGSLVTVFHDPTLSAHDKIVYWAYGDKGKYSSAQFKTAKARQEPLSIIATVKLQSEIPIMEIPIMQKDQEKASGKAYYIISSELLLKQLHLE